MSTNMRYITVPASVKIIDQKVNQQTREIETFGKKDYSYFELLREFVWSRVEWRKDEIHANAFNRLWEAHDEAEEQGRPVIALSQEDYVVFAPFATLKDVQIGGPNIAKLNRLTQCVTFASSTKPEALVKLEQEQSASANGAS